MIKLRTTLCLIIIAFSRLNESTADDYPNVVIFLADDQGWGDLSVSGNTNLATPHIDSLAHDGATIEHFYVCAVCAPTRAEFLTGRYHPRTGVSGVSTGDERLNADEVTIADHFKAAGYATAAFGKWHNGTQPPLHPNYRGFDEFYGFTSGHWGHYFSPPLDNNGQRVRGNGFVVDDFTDHAIEFIKANREQPFFCYLPFNTPHSPMMVPDRWYEKFTDFDPTMKHRDSEKEDVAMTRAALALCENIDWNVGRVLQTLDELQLRNDTIVVYFSDNGPNSWRWNGGMKGRKGSVDEGGLRSPFFLRWPGSVPKGLKTSQVAGAIDLLPTLTELANIECTSAKPLDGRSFAPLLRGATTELPERPLFSIWRNKVSLRTQQYRFDNDGHLFDIAADPGQQTDIAHEHPELATELSLQTKQFQQEMQALATAYANRPFHVGYGPSTTLPARDGVAHGTIQRSAKAPNNSFFENWTSTDDSITWDVDVGRAGKYEVVVYYTCANGDQGAELQLAMEAQGTNGSTQGDPATAFVTEAFDPPLYDKSKERVPRSHYFVKDFKPLTLGHLQLSKGQCALRLKALKKPGRDVIDVHSIDLNLLP
ncbi:arylsulfatase [Fuerstiella marisgermanici]|uniref:Arylsulfatase n=1 Tax=Fuerstiella marisgermanici TaxID=1891926 RepID=A0A1P8WII8_9PLAN|nr:arylsulfatase [Fuerstiella marisgermanici]APZ93847.1 Arylsulfatase [Fuerstiella marisgermanici]